MLINLAKRTKSVFGTFTTENYNGLLNLWNSQEGECALCGIKLDASAEVDHIIPVSRGGETTVDNLQFLHRRCNAIKSDSMIEELIPLLARIVRQWEGK